MNHIDFFENTVNDSSVHFETRFVLKQIQVMSLDDALITQRLISKFVELKHTDYDLIHEHKK